MNQMQCQMKFAMNQTIVLSFCLVVHPLLTMTNPLKHNTLYCYITNAKLLKPDSVKILFHIEEDDSL